MMKDILLTQKQGSTCVLIEVIMNCQVIYSFHTLTVSLCLKLHTLW